MPTLALHITCLVDQLYPEVGVATVKLLRRAGYTVEFPEAQTCCGQPFYNSGFNAQARPLAKRNIEIFEPYDLVVLPSGSCTTMIRKEYAHLFADEPEWQSRAEALAAKTYELTEFLAKLSPAQPRTPTTSVTYHDSCHMCRILGLRTPPRELLTQTGHAIVEMEESDRCCGFGGVFSVRMPEVSEAMTRAKLAEAQATGADTLVTADPGCLMQMRRYAAEYDLTVEHIATLLTQAK